MIQAILPQPAAEELVKTLVAFHAGAMNAKHAAAYLGVDPATFWEMRKKQPLAFPPVRLTDGGEKGQRRKGYRRADLDRWLADHTEHTVADAIRLNDRRRKISRTRRAPQRQDSGAKSCPNPVRPAGGETSRVAGRCATDLEPRLLGARGN